MDEAKLQTLAGGTCSLLESDELLRITGAVVGGVHPFIPNVSQRLLDKRVLKSQQVSFNTGDLSVGLVMRTSDLLKALQDQGTVVDIAVAEHGEEYEELALELEIAVPTSRFLLENNLVHYFRHCDSVMGEERAALMDALVDWMRALVRFAGQAGADPCVVSGDWLVELSRKSDATKFAREEALKQYLHTGKVTPVFSAAQRLTAGPPALLSACSLVGKTCLE